jgi:hypothetical protein
MKPQITQIFTDFNIVGQGFNLVNNNYYVIARNEVTKQSQNIIQRMRLPRPKTGSQ